MITLYINEGCEHCDGIEELFIKKNEEFLEKELPPLMYKVLKVKDTDKGQYAIDEEDNKIEFGENQIRTFPSIAIGGHLLFGKEIIESFLKKGYLDKKEDLFCPHIKEDCLGVKCGKYMLLTSDGLRIGNCNDDWKITIEIETRDKINKTNDLLDKAIDKLDLLSKSNVIGAELFNENLKKGFSDLKKQNLLINMIKPGDNKQLEENNVNPENS